MIIHSKYLRKIGILCVYQIDLFYHSYSAVVPIDMQFLYWGEKIKLIFHGCVAHFNVRSV